MLLLSSLESGALIHCFFCGEGNLARWNQTQREILIGSHYFLCDFALYGYTYHPSCCDCFCFCEVGIGVTCLLNATIYKNEFEHNIVLGAHGPLVQPSCSLRLNALLQQSGICSVVLPSDAGQTHKVRRE
jgi:hypothetical protein